MTGLNLETFLHVLRADLGAWASLGLLVVVLALVTWTSWGSRRVLRKCLVLSVIVHCGLVLYGSTVPVVLHALRPTDNEEPAARERIRQIRVAPWSEGEGGVRGSGKGRGASATPTFDRPRDALALADRAVAAVRPDAPTVELLPPQGEELPADTVVPEGEMPAPPKAEPRPPLAEARAPEPAAPAPGDPSDVAAVVPLRRSEAEPKAEVRPLPGSRQRLRPERSGELKAADRAPLPDFAALDAPTPRERLAARPGDGTPGGPEPAPGGAPEPGGPEVPGAQVARSSPAARVALPDTDLRRDTRSARGVAGVATPRRAAGETPPLALARVTPSGVARLPDVSGPPSGRVLLEVPEVYRPRLDPNRSARAERAGASAESEQAVERALDWLARHQDSDGRWDAATARYDDGSAKKGDDDFTAHCPPGETCFGECIYWEADTALTGLALLAYLGAGYTQADGKYAQTVGRGLGFLLKEQKTEGDLRGPSRAVGMYCHAMATLALCEAYALSRDDRLRKPVERAVGFLVRSRARDGMSWRYSPNEARGDTSILGWAVLALKSAKLVGVAVPEDTRSGSLAWLEKVSGGTRKGLGRYMPGKPVTPTMTAEAWVCRQFLGTGGPGAASDEAADYLLAHGPDRDPYNLYYWYYGTLAMYQHGGSAWTRWNAEVRDQIVRRQRVKGHPAGSWDPDDTEYGTSGGRVYCTALAALSLEVYYRFLRLYDEPQIPPALTPAPRRDDARLRRTSNPPAR